MNISFNTFGWGDLLGVIAVFVSIWSILRTRSIEKIQKELSEIQLKKEQDEILNKSTANVCADLISIGSGKYRLRIYNKGLCTARSVSYKIKDGIDLRVMDDGIFPLELLEYQQSVEFPALVYMGLPQKIGIELIWDDNNQSNNKKTMFITRK